MAYRSLLLFLAGAAMFGSTITTSLTVRENAAPSRHADLSIGDGASYVVIDLFRSTAAMELAVKQLGFCDTYGAGVTTCDFTPGGTISAADLNIPTSFLAANMIVLNGVPVPQAEFSDYRLSFTVNFMGGSPVQGTEFVEWGPVGIQANVSVALTRISEGLCVICVNALNSSGTATGLSSSGDLPYNDYRFSYAVAGPEAVPEPATVALIALGMVAIMITPDRRSTALRARRPRHP